MNDDVAKTDTGPAADDSLPVLVAFDSDDLAVVSANLQDALVRVEDMAYLPATRRFVLVLARFDWVAAQRGRMERAQTGLHFERVLKVMRSGFSQSRGEDVLNLLGIVFESDDPPGGHVDLIFSGGAAIRLDVECLEAQMRDIGSRWPTANKPGHAIDDEPA